MVERTALVLTRTNTKNAVVIVDSESGEEIEIKWQKSKGNQIQFRVVASKRFRIFRKEMRNV